ncbi:DUF4139 domain-containing protein [bacterium]|nr:DUF4139 domain-containing protein [bacterium]
MNRILLTVSLLFVLCANIFAETTVSITVYNSDLALVRDVRNIGFKSGMNEILFKDVSGQIDATSVHFNAPGVAMLEQNFDYDLVSSSKLIQKYIDHNIDVISESGELASGTLLTADGKNIVLKQKDGSLRSILMEAVAEIRYPELPEGLITRPTLRWLVDSKKAGDVETEVSYLTGGLSWRADYVLVIGEKPSDPADLSAWVTVNNNCGNSFKSAKLKLIAGEVNRVQQQLKAQYMRAAPMMEDAGASGFEERSFFEYHLYTLQRPTDLLDQQTKQVSLFPTTTINTKRIYEYDWRRKNDRVGVSIEFKNEKANGLGMAIPAGRVRIYQEDTDGSEEFIGEDNVEHTPKDEKIRVRTGEAFDIAVERLEKNYRRITDRVSERDYEVKLRNHKEEAVEVVVVDYLYGDWEILQSSHAYDKVSSRKVEFTIPVAPDKETILTYTVRTQ